MLSLTLLFIITLSFCSVGQVHAASTWTIQILSTNVVGDCGMALDSNNNPHIVYTERVGGYSQHGAYNAIYASWNGSTWINQIITENGGASNLDLDSHDNPHTLYIDVDNRLTYASLAGNYWYNQTVLSGDEYRGGGSLALDLANNPHIAYFTSGNETSAFFLKYASWMGSYWYYETVDAGDFSGTPSLKIDSQNQPHILYETWTVYAPQNSTSSLKYPRLIMPLNGQHKQ
jgi:hypothetical protein